MVVCGHCDVCNLWYLRCETLLLQDLSHGENVRRLECPAAGRTFQILCLEILSGICLINDGHQNVVRALSEVSPILGERTRFQKIIDDIHRNYRSERETERVRTAAMSLINAILSTGPAEVSFGVDGVEILILILFPICTSLEVRMHLRVEMLMLGLQGVVESLRDSSSTMLNDHLDFFEMSRQDDELHFVRSDSGSSTPVDLESASDIAEFVAYRLDSTLALPHFISLLQHLLLVPADQKHIHIWRSFSAYCIIQHVQRLNTFRQ
uniref:GBD/FH3 domain-containing protein n=1 Tax=Ascaris lumbricoides TaxID=6252 RepID=A0A0M3INY2_ASCLU